MNPYLRDRISRKLDTLSDERLYQVLDYIEFMESRYAEKPAAPGNLFQRFAEGVEDQMRAGGVAASTVAETMGLLGKAMGVLGGVAQTTVGVANEVAARARSAVDAVSTPSGQPAGGQTGAGAAPSPSQSAPPPPQQPPPSPPSDAGPHSNSGNPTG